MHRTRARRPAGTRRSAAGGSRPGRRPRPGTAAYDIRTRMIQSTRSATSRPTPPLSRDDQEGADGRLADPSQGRHPDRLRGGPGGRVAAEDRCVHRPSTDLVEAEHHAFDDTLRGSTMPASAPRRRRPWPPTRGPAPPGRSSRDCRTDGRGWPGRSPPLRDVGRRGLRHAEAQIARGRRIQDCVRVDAWLTLLGHEAPCASRPTVEQAVPERVTITADVTDSRGVPSVGLGRGLGWLTRRDAELVTPTGSPPPVVGDRAGHMPERSFASAWRRDRLSVEEREARGRAARDRAAEVQPRNPPPVGLVPTRFPSWRNRPSAGCRSSSRSAMGGCSIHPSRSIAAPD